MKVGDLVKCPNISIGSPVWKEPYLDGPVGPGRSQSKCIGVLNCNQIAMIVDSNKNYYRIIGPNLIGWVIKSNLIKIDD